MAKRETTDTIVIHCTQTPPGMDVDVDKVTQWHKERGFDTIYIPDLDIASGSRIANFAPITPAEHLVSEAIIVILIQVE